MHARLWCAIVHIDITQSSSHSRNAITREVCNQIDASRTDETWVAIALVDLETTVFAIVSRWAYALVVIYLR